MHAFVQHDTQGVAEQLGRLAARLDDPRPALHEIADAVRQQTEDRFRRQGAGDWAPLALDTIARRLRNGQGRAILDATGQLRRSLTRPAARGAVDTVTRDRLEIGTNVPYAPYVAARRDPFPPVDKKLVARTEDILANHVGGDR